MRTTHRFPPWSNLGCSIFVIWGPVSPLAMDGFNADAEDGMVEVD